MPANNVIAIDPDKLSLLQQRVTNSTEITAVVWGRDGIPMGEMANSNSDYCFLRKKPQNVCYNTHNSLFERARESRKVEWNICPHSGLFAAALPVYSGDEFVCAWLLCKFIYSETGGGTCRMPGSTQGDIPVLNRSALSMLMNMLIMVTEDVLNLEICHINQADMAKNISDMTLHDRLLGLPNSLGMDNDLQYNKALRTLIIIDVGDLRKINDVYGRECGDNLLTALRDYILTLRIPGSRLYRLDEVDFGLVVEEEGEAAEQLAKKLHRHCTDLWSLDVGGRRQDLFVTVNVGVLPVDRGYDTVFNNFSSAIEHTLDIAKKSDGFAMFDDHENKKFRERIKLELSLRHSVLENMRGFYVVYQPIVDPGMALWSGVEALCRWESDEFGAVSPAVFIDIAESAGLIGTIGIWVLEQAISQMKHWGLDKVPNFVLDVNLSPVQLADPALGDTVIDIITRYEYPPEKLCLEITESNELDFSRHSLDVLERLNSIGILIALDDFGTGYASFNSLHKLPVSILKTDRSLVNGVEHDNFLKRLFYVMAEMAHASDMKIVAEGIETDMQAQLLLKEGADYFQGFKFARPLPTHEIEKRLGNFHTPDRGLISMGYSQIDLSRLSDDQGGYQLTSALHRLLNRCMQTLFAAPDTDDSIEVVLSYVGEELNVSRTYVFLKEADGTYTNTHEWCGPGIVPEKEALQHMDIEGISPNWIRALTEDGMLVAADIRMLEKGSYDALSAQGIKAVVEFPILREGVLCGFVGFDDCESIHYWTREEIQMLHTLTSVIGSTLAKRELQNKLAMQSERMKSMLDNIDTFIYVTDMETDEILFANTELQSAYGERSLVGRRCWEALYNRKSRCTDCPVAELQENHSETFQWEVFNPIVDADLRCCDSVIPWETDKMAHLQYCLNITEIKLYQVSLEEFASVDMLTKTLNRGSFLHMAGLQLKSIYTEGGVATVAYLDIDGLRFRNEKYGHTAGDALICQVVESLRDNMHQTDLIGRVGGDEFVILFGNCAKRHAERNLHAALSALADIAIDSFSYSFTYGLADTTELKNASPNPLVELMDLADVRMRKVKDVGQGSPVSVT